MTTAFAYREIEDSPNVINRNDGEEYAQCECGRMILASYLEDNGQCRECYDEKHTCAYCTTLAERELPKSADGHRYCDACYREIAESAIFYAVRELKRLAEGAEKELASAKDNFINREGPADFLAYGANVAGHLSFLSSRLPKIIADLEAL
jgi:hypothetical protein